MPKAKMVLDSKVYNAATFSDTELVKACREGDLDAFEFLVKKYQNLTLALALSYIPNFHDAQEIAQEAFLNAYCKLSQLSDAEHFKSWLCTIVINLCQSWLRRKTGIFLPLDESVQADISRLSVQHDRQERLFSSIWEEVFTLPEKYRMVILLYYMGDYSYNEIADFLDVPVSTVKGRLQQARLRLKRELQPADKEELKMGRVDSEFNKKVRITACQIATEPVKEVVSLEETEHIVLFFGVQADIEVRQHNRDVVEITGTKYSLGGEEKQARESVSRIMFHIDSTDDYWEVGPHRVMLFSGTNVDNEGMPHGEFVSAEALWRGIRNELKEGQGPISDIIRDLPRKAVRITVGQEREGDIVLSPGAYTDEIRRIFYVNYSDDKQIHGPTGYMNLVISIPIGRQFTLIKGGQIRVSGVHGCLHFISCSSVALDNMEGTVCLYDSHLAQARNVKGNLFQYFHQLGGGDWSGHSAKRVGHGFETKLQRITGNLYIDVGKVLIEASEIEGKTIIKNRFGATRFYQASPRSEGDCEIWSSSGDVVLFIGEKSIGEISIATKTLCGEINYSGLKEISLPYKWNTPREIYVGTVRDFGTANMQIQTESGGIRMERMALDV